MKAHSLKEGLCREIPKTECEDVRGDVYGSVSRDYDGCAKYVSKDLVVSVNKDARGDYDQYTTGYCDTNIDVVVESDETMHRSERLLPIDLETVWECEEEEQAEEEYMRLCREHQAYGYYRKGYSNTKEPCYEDRQFVAESEIGSDEQCKWTDNQQEWSYEQQKWSDNQEEWPDNQQEWSDKPQEQSDKQQEWSNICLHDDVLVVTEYKDKTAVPSEYSKDEIKFWKNEKLEEQLREDAHHDTVNIVDKKKNKAEEEPQSSVFDAFKRNFLPDNSKIENGEKIKEKTEESVGEETKESGFTIGDMFDNFKEKITSLVEDPNDKKQDEKVSDMKEDDKSTVTQDIGAFFSRVFNTVCRH